MMPLRLLFVATAAAAAATPFCAQCANGGAPPMENTLLHAACADAGATIAAVLFASYGTPTGTCPAFARGACDAATSASVVQAACVGRRECVVYPNTTTFGDPCFGTAKTLAVALTCSTGAGSADCGVAPPPPPPVLANFSAAVNVHWDRVTASVYAAPSIQVVSHHALWRTAPTHDQAFATLRQLGSQSVRFVPWVPYAQHGVGELMPPSYGGALCGRQNWAVGAQVEPETLDCGPLGGTIESVTFASYGKATGNCGAYARSATCDAANSSAVVAALCVGKPSCVVPTASGGAYGAPCDGAYLAVQLQCSNHSLVKAYWNMTLPDQFMSDWWDAVDGDNSNGLPNFSTQPTWLYSPADYNWNADPAQPWGYSRGSFSNCNNTLLGEYYARLYGYFATGEMVDEGGVRHTRPGGALKIRQIEVFNEVDYEHGYDVEGYTAAFDAVVRGVRSFDTGHTIRFVGLNLPNIDNAQKVATWAAYFLNATNHAPDARDALDIIGYHAYPTNGPYTPDPTSFALMFDYVDAYIEGVKVVDSVIEALSPDTVTYLDETGTDMDGVLGAGPPPGNNPRYWVAAAGYWAYMFAKAVNESATVRQVGASQLMDAPGQEPSVTLLDWSTGLGTARFWAVKLISESIVGDDVLTAADVAVTGADADALFAVGFMTPDQNVKQALLINKRNAFAQVTVSCGSGPCNCASLKTIDEFTGLQPARTDSCGAGAITLAPYATSILLFE